MNIIERALQTLPGNWIQGDLHNDNGACGLGHLHLNATRPWHDEVTAGAQTMDIIANEQYPDRVSDYLRVDADLCKFARFNDHPDTTEADVIAVMEKAAVRLNEMVDIS